MTQDHSGVFGGVDTHKHTHVAAALDGAGRVLGSAAFDADAAGYTALLVAAGDNPGADAQRGVLRRAVRHQPHRGVLGAHRAPPAQPQRQPARQQRPVAHRHGPAALRRAQHRLRPPPTRRGQDPPRDRALPQAPHRTRDLPAAHRPAPSAQRRRPAPTAHPTRTHHPPDSPSPRSSTQVSELERDISHNRELAERYQRHLAANTT